MKDTIRSGIFAGLLGSLGDDAVHITAYFLVGTSTTGHYISQLIFPFKEVTLFRWAFGDATHWFAGALMGIAVALIFKYFGSDYAYLKGIGFGITMWIVHVIVIPNLVQPRPYLFRSELEALIYFIAHAASEPWQLTSWLKPIRDNQFKRVTALKLPDGQQELQAKICQDGNAPS